MYGFDDFSCSFVRNFGVASMAPPKKDVGLGKDFFSNALVRVINIRGRSDNTAAAHRV